MTPIDWIMIAVWVIGTSAFGIYFKKYISSTKDYLLAGRTLKWWQIAIAQSNPSLEIVEGLVSGERRTGHDDTFHRVEEIGPQLV